MHLVVEHGVDGVDAGHADRRRRQPLVPVGIVGRLVFQVFVQDAPQPEVLHGILDRRIGLQGHPLAQAVDVHPCDTGHLVGLAGLLVDDRCEGHDLEPAQTAAFAQGIAPGRPETVVLALHALHELFGRHRPVELVGVGNEHRKERHAVEPHATRHFGRGQHLHARRGVGVALPGGTAADIEVAPRAHGIPVKLLPQDKTRDKQARKAGEKDIAKSFFTHRAENFCKDIKNSYFCARESLIRPAPTESPRRGIEQGYVVVAVRCK